MDMMAIRRRVLMGGRKKKSRLPDEYQEVEYIEGTGTQYIDVTTSLKEREFEIVLMPTAKRTNGAMFTGGSLYSDTDGACALIWTSGIGVRRILNKVSGDSATTSIDGVLNKKIRLKCYKSLAEVSNEDTGEIIVNNTNIVSSLWGIPIFLFHGGSNGAYRTRYVKGRIYYAKYLSGGALEAELIPCYRKSDEEIGMYDTVSKTFFTNSGTGTFLKGVDV